MKLLVISLILINSFTETYGFVHVVNGNYKQVNYKTNMRMVYNENLHNSSNTTYIYTYPFLNNQINNLNNLLLKWYTFGVTNVKVFWNKTNTTKENKMSFCSKDYFQMRKNQINSIIIKLYIFSALYVVMLYYVFGSVMHLW